jgi:hypothetical protein
MPTDNANLISRFLSYLRAERGAGETRVAGHAN